MRIGRVCAKRTGVTLLLAIAVISVSSCANTESRLAPVADLAQDSSTASAEVVIEEPVPADVVPAPEEPAPESTEPTDSLADVESAVVVPKVEVNFILGAESACVGALALTPSGQLSTPGFTYDDKSCRLLIDSIPIPDLPKNDIETAYQRGFQEMLGIMFRPGQLCAPTGECFTKDQVLPVEP
jgi:hypothetical protein